MAQELDAKRVYEEPTGAPSENLELQGKLHGQNPPLSHLRTLHFLLTFFCIGCGGAARN